MSQWTHVAATIRFDALRLTDMPDQTPDLGTPVTWEDGNFDSCNMPCGSEGSLQHMLWTNPMTNALAAYTAAIWGDLRDYSDVDEIKAYLARITDGQSLGVRQGVAEIDYLLAVGPYLPFLVPADRGLWPRQN